jgi:hypothetical protein
LVASQFKNTIAVLVMGVISKKKGVSRWFYTAKRRFWRKICSGSLKLAKI